MLARGRRPPHIVIFNPDQWRGDVVGHLGNPAAHTPTLDALAASEATSFRHAFCQNPVCVPSRCSFMTGWYPHVRGHRTFGHLLRAHHGEPNALTLLKRAGYHVWWGGKNHLVPAEHGFDAYCDVKFRPDDGDYARWGHTPRPFAQTGNQADPSLPDWRGAPGSDTYYSFYVGALPTDGDDLYCDPDWAVILGAIDLIRSYDGDRPLCLYLPLMFPHPPYAVEARWREAIDRALLPPRAPPPADWAGKPSILGQLHRRFGLGEWEEARWDELRATYYGMCARVDHQLGLLVEALRAAGMWDDTALLFFSDHGDYTGDYDLVEKTQNTFEDALVRVPFLLKPPRSRARCEGRISPALVELVDVAATLYDLAGIEPGYTHFGRSLLPIAAGEATAHRDAVFCEGGRRRGETHAMERGANEHPDGLYWPRVGLQVSDDAPYHSKAVMCRTADHKYVHRLYERDELYDLGDDPAELRNLIDDPDHAPLVAELRQRLLTWFLDTADAVPHDLDAVEWSGLFGPTTPAV